MTGGFAAFLLRPGLVGRGIFPRSASFSALRKVERGHHRVFPLSSSDYGVAPVLLNPVASIPVFRAAVLSLALLFVGLPQAALLCRNWCEPVAAHSGCHRDASTVPGIAGVEYCGAAVLNDAAVVTDQLRPRPSFRETVDGPAPSAYRPPSLLSGGVHTLEPPGCSLARSPIVTILRI